MKNQSSEIECPECGCREIHTEYNSYGHGVLSAAFNMADEGVPAEPGWCCCMGCGVMFDPVQEGFTVQAVSA
jgi:hypothetical protein